MRECQYSTPAKEIKMANGMNARNSASIEYIARFLCACAYGLLNEGNEYSFATLLFIRSNIFDIAFTLDKPVYVFELRECVQRVELFDYFIHSDSYFIRVQRTHANYFVHCFDSLAMSSAPITMLTPVRAIPAAVATSLPIMPLSAKQSVLQRQLLQRSMQSAILCRLDTHRSYSSPSSMLQLPPAGSTARSQIVHKRGACS